MPATWKLCEGIELITLLLSLLRAEEATAESFTFFFSLFLGKTYESFFSRKRFKHKNWH